MRSRFDEQLALLSRELTQMGALCEEVIALAGKAITTGDLSMAEKVAPLDGEIDRMEHSIEALCLKLLLQQQPVARDLRQISAALKMITDMERIGDQASDIAEIILFLGGRTMEPCGQIDDMAQATINMDTESIDALVKKSVETAQSVIDQDDIVDGYFIKMKNAIIQLIAENQEDGEFALDLLMISKYFERIGDHAVNVAEWVIYSVTGVHKEE